MFFWRKNRNEKAGPTQGDALPEPSERTILGAQWRFKGRVHGTGQLLVQSVFEGELELRGILTVGPSGILKGTFNADEAWIGGSLEGSLNCSRLVVLEESARLDGDVAAPRLQMETGARFNGGIDMDRGQKERGDDGKRT